MPVSVVHISHPGGHRASYRDLFADMFGYMPVTGPAKKHFWTLLRSRRLLFATLDGDIEWFILIALLRAFRFKRTCGLFVGPLGYLREQSTLRRKLRVIALRALKSVPMISVFSIVPHELRPELKKLTSDWIHDPQLWDLGYRARETLPSTELAESAQACKLDRNLLLFLGKGSKRKGLDELVRYTDGLESDLFVVVAGPIQPECATALGTLRSRGMLVEDRFLSEDEFLSLYRIADYSWCLYASDYDQASGIFGRSIQLGVVPVIRKGSVLDDYAVSIGCGAIRMSQPGITACEAFRHAMSSYTTEQSTSDGGLTTELARTAVAKLRRALGEESGH